MWIWLVAIDVSVADPFNTWPERTPPGDVAFNPYVGVGPAFASTFLFVGMGDAIDFIGGYSAGIEGGEGFLGPADAYIRVFPWPNAEIALVAHGQYTDAENWFIGPEIHAMTRPTDWFGLWLDAGWRGRDAGLDPGFLWVGTELAAERPFLAFEADFEFALDGTTTTTLIPSVGVWLGAEGATGLSAGVFVPIGEDAPLGVGAWLWRSVSLKRNRTQDPIEELPPRPYYVEEGCSLD
ncbi:MAG: hypothetical protein AAGA48_16840 [Myxococcota bacterium]